MGVSSKIIKTIQETSEIKTFILEKPEIAKKAYPGQFVMVWVPDAEEVPMSLSYINPCDGLVGITVRQVGDTTKKMFELKEGDFMGIRGPYGHGYDLRGEQILTISSGCATASIPPLVEEAIAKGKKVCSIVGGLTKETLILLERFKKAGAEVHPVTGDGSIGAKGHVTDILNKLIEEGRKFDIAYVCATENRMNKIIEITEKYNIQTQVSIERPMKCGTGICGVCAMDPSGLLACKDGPVFWAWELKETEFGKYKRDLSTTKIKI